MRIRDADILAKPLSAVGFARRRVAAIATALRQQTNEPEAVVAEAPPWIMPGPLHIADVLIEVRGEDAFWVASLEAVRQLKAGDQGAFREWKSVADAISQLEEAAERAKAEPATL
jgi:hypothetical protein